MKMDNHTMNGDVEAKELTAGQFLIAAAGILLFVVLVSTERSTPPYTAEEDTPALEEAVLPKEGVVLPIRWGDIGAHIVEAGVIDITKLKSLYTKGSGPEEDMAGLFHSAYNGNIVMNEQNAEFLLRLLWAFGLSNENPILEKGPMQDERYGGADRFASTGGWTLSKGDAMVHYSKHSFVTLTEEEQALVEEVSRDIYRPCCDNPTYFPDCNHGMAMLGLLELLAAQGADEEEMYRVALQVNSYWFPDIYLTVAKYFEMQGISWNDVNPKEVLGREYSSASGYRRILKEVEQPEFRGGSCSV
jgi:hypothetical protein